MSSVPDPPLGKSGSGVSVGDGNGEGLVGVGISRTMFSVAFITALIAKIAPMTMAISASAPAAMPIQAPTGRPFLGGCGAP
jgi:hypothetical protein